MSGKVSVDSFEAFYRGAEPRLRQALSSTLGSEHGRTATADVLSYAWERWDRVRSMGNPVGYLYVMGRDRSRPRSWRPPALLPCDPISTPWIEPGLPRALADLPDRQRVVVMLLHCFQWTMSEVAELLGISKATVQTHDERGLARLRSEMGVTV